VSLRRDKYGNNRNLSLFIRLTSALCACSCGHPFICQSTRCFRDTKTSLLHCPSVAISRSRIWDFYRASLCVAQSIPRCIRELRRFICSNHSSLRRKWECEVYLLACMFVCLSVCSNVSKTARPNFTKSLRMSHVTVVRSFFDGNATRYVLPV